MRSLKDEYVSVEHPAARAGARRRASGYEGAKRGEIVRTKDIKPFSIAIHRVDDAR